MPKAKTFLKYQKYIYPYRRKLFLSLVVTTIGLALGMIPPLITKALIDYAYPHQDIFLLTCLIASSILIFLIAGYFDNIGNYLDMFIENDLTVKLKEKFFNNLQKFSIQFHSKNKAGDLMFRINDDIGTVVTMIVQFIPALLETIFHLIFLLVICMVFDWKLTLLALTGIPLYLLETKFFAHKQKLVVQEELAKSSEINSFLHEKIPAIKIIKSFSRERSESKIFQKKIEELFYIVRQSSVLEFLNTFTDPAQILKARSADSGILNKKNAVTPLDHRGHDLLVSLPHKVPVDGRKTDDVLMSLTCPALD